MKIAPRRSIVGFAFSIFIASALLLIFSASDNAQGVGIYNPTASQRLCNRLPADWPSAPGDPDLRGNPACTNLIPATGVPRTITTDFYIPATDANFSNIVWFDPLGVTHTPGCNVDDDGDPKGILDDRDWDGDGVGDNVTCLRPGDKVGGMRNITSLGFMNNPCGQIATQVDFVFYNVALPNDASNPRGSTNIYTPAIEGTGTSTRYSTAAGQVPGAGYVDIDADNIGDVDPDDPYNAAVSSQAITNYPDWLLDLFDADWRQWVDPITGLPKEGPKDGVTCNPGTNDCQNPNDGPKKPIIPIAVYGAWANITGSKTPLYFVQFDSGQLSAVDNADGFAAPHPFSRAVASLGKPSQTVLTDTTPIIVSPNPVTDFCTALITRLMMLGTSATDNVTVSTTPATAGSHPGKMWSSSQRDLDNDGYDHPIDTCVTAANIDTDPRDPANGGGPDQDMIDGACDPRPNFLGCDDIVGGDTDCDGDLFANAQDNCPLVSNPKQVESENLQVYGSAAPDGGPRLDGMGDECDVGTVKFIQNRDPLDPTMPFDATGPGSGSNTLADTVNDLSVYNGDCVEITGGAGAAQARSITAAAADEITVDSDWVVAIDNTSDYLISTCTQVDLSPTVANGRYNVEGIMMPNCYGAASTDGDGDGWCLSDEPLGATGDATTLLHPNIQNWTTFNPAADHDGDGANAWVETFQGTDETKDCNATLAPAWFDEPLDNLGHDLNDDMKTNVQDHNILQPAFFTNRSMGGSAYDQRLDMNADTYVNVLDHNIQQPWFFTQCDYEAQQ